MDPELGEREIAAEVRELTKRFPGPAGGTLTAVDRVSFQVHKGEVFGFLGPNGAGKTTTLEVIEGLQEPTSGSTFVFGLDSHRQREEVKQRIGVQLQASAYFEYLTLEEILDLFGSWYPRRVEPAGLLDKVGLLDKRKALVKELSGGQAQRFSIVAAMVNDPDVLFLDEPTTGLDPQARRNLWELIRAINDEGKTVVLTTHYMEEAETLCDRIAIIDLGTIRALDTPIGLIRSLPAAYRITFNTSTAVDEAELARISGVSQVERDRRTGAYSLSVHDSSAVLPLFLDHASTTGIPVQHLEVLPATLEEVFLSVTGHSLRE